MEPNKLSNYDFYPVEPLVEPLSDSVPVLTPNLRLARLIRRSWGRWLAAQGHNAWQTPCVMSLDHWWQDCYRQRSLAGDELPALISPQQERALWLECVQGSGHIALLRPAAAAELAAEAYRNLRLWDMDWRHGSLRQQFQFSEDSALFLEWAMAFEARLERLGLATLPALVPTLAQRCPVAQLVITEFDELAPMYRAALDAQAGSIIEHRQHSAEADCYLQACDTHRAELEAAVAWAFDQHREAPTRRLAILLPQLQQERSEIERLLHRRFGSDPRRPDTLPVNFSAGIPLSACGPVQAALNLLALPAREHSISDVGRMINSRYRDRQALEQEQQAWLQLCRNAREPVSPAQFRQLLARSLDDNARSSALQRVLLEVAQPRSLRSSTLMVEWPDRFAALLSQFGWPGSGPLDSLEYQQVEQFYQLLSSLAELAPLQASLDYPQALAALEQACSNSVFQAQSPDAPIQVLGTLEAAGLQFDALWICNMGAGEWPPAPRPNPFIPVALQRRAGMPHADAQRELAYAERLMAHLRRSTTRLVASYATQEDEVTVAPSALVADFETLPDITAHHWPGYWQRSDGALLESIVEDTAPAVADEEAAGIAGGSAILGNQAQCPFRAFARHRLEAHPIPDPQVAISAADRGAILHEALYHLWGELGSQQALKRLDEPSRRLLAERSAGVAVDSFRQGRGRYENPGLLDLEHTRLIRLLLRWLEVEIERSDFIVSDREVRHDVELGSLSLTLRVDRIDLLPNGRRLLIDYKSGDARPRQWLGQRPEEPQLPLYTRLFPPEEVEGISFGILRHSNTEYRGLARTAQGSGIGDDIARETGRTDAEQPDWDALQLHWDGALEALIREFLAGHAAVAPLDPRRTCTYCGLDALCRIR